MSEPSAGYAYDDWDVPLASQVMLEIFRSLVDDEDDDREIPVGRLLAELGDEINVNTSGIDQALVCTAGELRERIRHAIEALAYREARDG
jgi:hypothetical protein